MEKQLMNSYKARLFRDRWGQAVELPPGLDLPLGKALMRKEGDKLIVGPADPADEPEWVAAWKAFEKQNGRPSRSHSAKAQT
jgi:virulence-associated protein VagC